MGDARIGIALGEMDRTISFNGCRRNNESRWSGTANALMPGEGKNCVWTSVKVCSLSDPMSWFVDAF